MPSRGLISSHRSLLNGTVTSIAHTSFNATVPFPPACEFVSTGSRDGDERGVKRVCGRDVIGKYGMNRYEKLEGKDQARRLTSKNEKPSIMQARGMRPARDRFFPLYIGLYPSIGNCIKYVPIKRVRVELGCGEPGNLQCVVVDEILTTSNYKYVPILHERGSVGTAWGWNVPLVLRFAPHESLCRGCLVSRKGKTRTIDSPVSSV